jgi:hypothetical protein
MLLRLTILALSRRIVALLALMPTVLAVVRRAVRVVRRTAVRVRHDGSIGGVVDRGINLDQVPGYSDCKKRV